MRVQLESVKMEKQSLPLVPAPDVAGRAPDVGRRPQRGGGPWGLTSHPQAAGSMEQARDLVGD